MRGLSNGPNSSKYRTGWTMPMMTHAGLRRFIRSWRRKTMEHSRRNRMSALLAGGCGLGGLDGVAQRAAGEGQEDVVQRGAVHLDRLEGDVRLLEVTQQAWNRLAGALDPAAHMVAVD